MSHRMSSTEMQHCIQNCLDCHRPCLQTAAKCLQHGGQHAAAQHITLMLDCAQICLTSADFCCGSRPGTGRPAAFAQRSVPNALRSASGWRPRCPRCGSARRPAAIVPRAASGWRLEAEPSVPTSTTRGDAAWRDLLPARRNRPMDVASATLRARSVQGAEPSHVGRAYRSQFTLWEDKPCDASPCLPSRSPELWSPWAPSPKAPSSKAASHRAA